MDQNPAPQAETPQTEPVGAPHVSLATIFWIFFQIGSLSVGGGLSAWLYREIVEQRKLMPAADFLSALTLAQVLPGINMMNLSVYVGQRLRGLKGVLAAVLGLLLVPFFGIIAVGTIYAQLEAQPRVHDFLDGMAATAVALLLSMGIRAVKVTRMQPQQLGIAAAVIVLVGIARVPMVPVILVLAPISVWLAWQRQGGSKERDSDA
jgi:chromate transporter